VRVLRILHKWLGLIVGLQILLWTVSGLVFAWLDHEAVAAERSLRQPPQPVISEDARLLAPEGLLDEYGSTEILDITLMPVHENWVYRVRLADRVELRRAENGASFAIGERLIRDLATAHYAGDGELRAVSFHSTPTIEARGAGAVWQAAFDDPERTSLYFSAEDGRFVAARNESWRLFDFFWMLHTMDYRGRDNFNHPLVILFATGALWLGIAGAILLYPSFRSARRLDSGPGSRA